MKFNKIDKILILGRSGCGKSFLAKKIVSAYPRLIIFDPLDEHATATMPFVFNFDQFAESLKKISDEKIKSFKLVVKIDTDIENFIEIFDLYARLLYEFGDTMVLIEEVQDFCTPYLIGKFFKKCMTSGRHKDLSFCFTTQRPSFLNKNIFSQSTHIFVGNLIDQNDVKTVTNCIDAEKKDVTSLDDCHFLWFSPKRKPHTIPFKTK